MKAYKACIQEVCRSTSGFCNNECTLGKAEPAASRIWGWYLALGEPLALEEHRRAESRAELNHTKTPGYGTGYVTCSLGEVVRLVHIILERLGVRAACRPFS
jgi:hypothetical protein